MKETNKILLIMVVIGAIYRLVLAGLAPPTTVVESPGEVLSRFETTEWNPFRMPLFYLILGALPEQHIFTLALGILTLPLLYLLCIEFFSEKISLYSVLFLALLPKHAYMGSTNTPIIAAIFFGLLSLYLLIRAERRGFPIKMVIASGVSATFGYLMDFPGIIVPGILLFYVFSRKQLTSKGKTRVIVVFLIPVLIAVAWHLISMQHLFGPMLENAGMTVYFSESYSPIEKTLRLGGYSYFDFWWHARGFDTEVQLLSFIGSVVKVVPIFVWALALWVVATVILGMLVLLGISSCLRKLEGGGVILLFLWLGFYLVFWVSIVLIGGGIMVRHIFPIIVAVSIFFGVGMARKDTKITRILVVSALSVLVLTSLIHAVYLNERVQAFYGPASEWIEKNIARDEKILAVGLPYPWGISMEYDLIYASGENIDEGIYEEVNYIYLSSYKVGQEGSGRDELVSHLLDILNESSRFELVFDYKSSGYFSKDVWVEIYKNYG